MSEVEVNIFHKTTVSSFILNTVVILLGFVPASVISLILMVLGFLFAFAISHDLINKEIELKTIRLLITKTSSLKLMLGKFLGTLLFWIVTEIGRASCREIVYNKVHTVRAEER